MKNSDTVIHLVILATIVSFGMLFYSLGMQMIEKETLVLEEVRQVGDRLDTLNERVSTNDNVGSSSEVTTRPADGVEPGVTTVSVEGFGFELPEGWYTGYDSRELGEETDGVNVEFNNSEDVKVATMRCPVVETGYEAWDFERSTMVVNGDDTSYEVELQIGEPTAEDVGPLSLITFMEDDEAKCEIVSNMDTEEVSDFSGIDQTFRGIFESVTIE